MIMSTKSDVELLTEAYDKILKKFLKKRNYCKNPIKKYSNAPSQENGSTSGQPIGGKL